MEIQYTDYLRRVDIFVKMGFVIRVQKSLIPFTEKILKMR